MFNEPVEILKELRIKEIRMVRGRLKYMSKEELVIAINMLLDMIEEL